MPTKANGPLMEDYTRALKVAKKHGWREVAIKFPGGYEVILREGGEAIAPPEIATSLIDAPAPSPTGSQGRWRAPNPRGEQAIDVLRALLRSGPQSAQQMRAALMREGYSVASLGTWLDCLKSEIVRTDHGVYALETKEVKTLW